METLRFEARGTFRARPDDLWPLLADTPKINRAIGAPAIEYTVTPAEGGGSHVEAQARLLGMPLLRWTEHPFRWEAPRRYLVIRDYHGGPFRRLRFGVDLTPKDGQTEVLVHAEILPRHGLGSLVARRAGPRAVQTFLKQCDSFERYLLGEAEDPFPQLAPREPLAEAAQHCAARLADQGLNQQAVELLRRHLAEAHDEEVVKMRPFELADRWGIDRRETLALFLHATVAGLLVMTWDVLCPNCRIGKAEFYSLRDVSAEAHCEYCNITFDANFDRLVEVRFTVAPALRQVANRMYCIGGPMNTAHVLAQTTVPPAGTERLSIALPSGPYRLRSAKSNAQLVFETTDEKGAVTATAPTPLTVVVKEDELAFATTDLPAGPLELELVNETDREQLLVLEGDLWPDTVCTAALVSTMQEFRDLFASEVLAPGLQLSIENLAFMFTDLTGSTALYQAIGQARAFRLVQDHFGVLGGAISANQGALVKTIGDAVMATFPSGADALAAAFQIQRDIHQLEAPEGVDTAHLVKVGLHAGPCVAVTLNDRLDYFGTTVNTAARIEHECQGGQIVASVAACQSDRAAALLREAPAELVEDVVRLRGVAEPVAVYCITPRESPLPDSRQLRSAESAREPLGGPTADSR
jgi:class 3 adenylate cyclase